MGDFVCYEDVFLVASRQSLAIIRSDFGRI